MIAFLKDVWKALWCNLAHMNWHQSEGSRIIWTARGMYDLPEKYDKFYCKKCDRLWEECREM